MPVPPFRTIAAVVAGALLFAAPGGAARAEPSERPDDKKPRARECVAVSTEARPRGYGYDHVVVLKNECGWKMRCSVKTDATSEAIVAEVKPKGEKEVLTRRNSPARSFKAQVSCKPG
jgi:hypothetical protein